MTRDAQKGWRYRQSTDANFRRRKRREVKRKHDKARRQALSDPNAHCAKCGTTNHRVLEYHETAKGGYLMCRRCHKAFHTKRGDFNSRGGR